MKTRIKVLLIALVILVMVLLVIVKVMLVGNSYLWVSILIGTTSGVLSAHIWDKGDL